MTDDAVVVTGTRLPVSATGIAQHPRILPAEQIRGRSSLHEALRTLPELHVDQPGAPAGFSSLYLRGADPNHTVYLIDGFKVNDPTNVRGGGFDFGSLDPQTIERIELLPGASSAIYGADAMAGVVNILTRAPRGSGVRLGGGLGGLGYRALNASVDGKTLRADAAATEDGGERDLGFKRIRTISLRASRVSVRAWQHETRAFPEDSGGPAFAVLRELERREGSALMATGHADMRLGRVPLQLRLGALAQEQDRDSPGVAPGSRDPIGLPRTLSAARFHRWNAVLHAQFGHALVGVEYQREDGDMQSELFFGPFALPADFALKRDTRSVFAEARGQLAPRLSLQGGVRVDDVEAFRTHASVQTGVRYEPAAGPALAVNLGTGFKPPSFFALGDPLVGNRDLRPEESETAEVSIASSEESRLRHRASLFRANYTDLIDFDPGPPPRLVNRSDVVIKGLEYSFAANLARGLRVAAGASRFFYDLPEGADPLRSRPRSKVTAALRAPLTEPWSFQVSAVRVGRVFDSSIPTGGRYLDPYVVVDAALHYAMGKTQAVLALDNAFDRRYEQFIGFPAAGRRLRAQVNVGF